MVVPPLPANESSRLKALDQYDILDTEREEAYDDFTMLAAHICGTPIALMTFVDTHRQWFKSRIGLDVAETPREHAFCAHAIVDNRTLVVGDAVQDRRFHDNPLVTGDPGIRFYAGAPLVTGDGEGLGTLCVIDRVPRTLTADQQRALEALSRRVMAQLELRRAMAALRSAEAAKKKFVANVSHELRTPLTSIRGALALVLDATPGLDEDAVALLNAAHRNADRLVSLVNDLLDLERVGSGEFPVTKRPCALQGVIDRAVDTVRPIARDAGVSLAAPATALQLEADAERLSQVIINLLANAVRFSPRGTTVAVAVQHDRDRMQIFIDDQGPGVPAAFREVIFEPFKQIEGSAAHEKGGTGLGLAIANAIVKEHGGSLAVSDAPGGGARFIIDIPLTSSRSPSAS